MTAVRVVLRRDRRVLLVQRSADSLYGARQWEIPGGTVDPLEGTLPALKREVREETGIVIYPSRTASLTTVNNEDGESEHIFLCTRFRRRPGVRARVRISDEHTRYRWVTVERALGMDLTFVTRAVMEFLLE